MVCVLSSPVQTGEDPLQRLPNTSPLHPPRGWPTSVRMFHPHQAPKYMARAGIRLVACTAVRRAVYTDMTLPQGAGKAALPRDVGRGAAHRVDISSRLTRQGQPGSRSLDPFSPSRTMTRLCSHTRCPSIGLTLVSRAGQCGLWLQAETHRHWLTRVHPC